jgi:hypothetical protein
MFKLVYLKLRKNLHHKISDFYSSWIVEHPVITIFSYLGLFICFSFGLFHIQPVTDSNEALTAVKNSEYIRNSELIKKTFNHVPDRYFQHQLTDLGYYIEFIVLLKNTHNGQFYNSSYNFLNETILNEYNELFDQVLSLKIHDSLAYSDLCARRLNKCAIEGGIVRVEQFQKKLINKEIKYDKNDPGSVYIDPELLDGTSFDFTFGMLRKEKCNKKECTITQVGLIRNRFDFLAFNSTQIKLAFNYMHKFADLMDNLKKNATKFNYIQFSYHTSHTLESEIAKYSLNDLKYVGVGFIIFWICYLMILTFGFERCNLLDFLKKIISFFKVKKINNNEKTFCSNLKSHFFDSHSTLVIQLSTSAIVFIVLLTFLQFLITLLSTFGLMSLLGFTVNQLLYSIVFVLISKYLFLCFFF